MKHFKDQNNKIYAFEADGSQDHLITDGMVEITEAERDAIIEKNKPALTWDDIRAKRDGLLSETDWTQLADAPLTAEQSTAYETYRQTLRDIPQDFNAPDGNPEDVIYPEKP